MASNTLKVVQRKLVRLTRAAESRLKAAQADIDALAELTQEVENALYEGDGQPKARAKKPATKAKPAPKAKPSAKAKPAPRGKKPAAKAQRKRAVPAEE